jgi:lipoate-protein ligase A
VTNIAPYMPQPMTVENFGNVLFSEISKQMDCSQIYNPTQSDLDAIQKLSDEKYRTWDWIYGYSPRYRFTNKLETEKGEMLIRLFVETGLLTEAAISGVIHEKVNQKFAETLLGCRHDLEETSSRIYSLNGLLQAEGISPTNFIRAMF